MKSEPESTNPVTSDRSADSTEVNNRFLRISKDIVRFGPSLPMILAAAAGLRLAAALAVEYLAQRRGSICLFGDTPIYWLYGKAIAFGTPYVVNQWEVPHHALRTPGYPLWLAANMSIFGESSLAVRISQAALGVLMVWWIHRAAITAGLSERSARWSAAIVAIDLFQVGLSALILSESLFTPLLVLLVLQLIRMTQIEDRPVGSLAGSGGFFMIGALQAVLGLVRPSWLAYLPVVILAAVSLTWKGQGGARRAVISMAAVMAGWCVVTTPWALRNLRTIDRFAVTGTWGGATLYDSVRPGATGASDMKFVADPQFRDLAETVQDDLWKRLSFEAITAEPGRILRLAVEKQKRFWSPWPNDSAKLPLIGKMLSAAIVLPVWAAMVAGWLRNRRRGWAYLVLSPLVVTALTHLLFVGSSRYRMAVIVPAMVLAGEGIELAMKAIDRRRERREPPENQDEIV